jgi:hypothetical protein
MKKHEFYLKALVIGLLTSLTFACSETEQFPENALPAPISNEVTTNDPVVLTKSEAVALAVQQKGTYKITEDEALQNLDRFRVSDLGGEETGINITDVVLRKKPGTEKELYYEVVFESEKGAGFSLLSADERTDHILCYSEVGALSDTSFNKSLKFCLELVKLYIEEQTKEELAIDSLVLSARAKSINLAEIGTVNTKAMPYFDPNNPGSGGWTYARTDVTTTVSERLKTVTTAWHQRFPFNAYLPLLYPNTSDTTRAYAGCVMIAVAQIMAYHKKPFSNYITTAMWPTMISNYSTSVDLKNLIHDLFNNMVISYNASGSSSTQTRARNFLNSNGYTAGPIIDYSYNNVWNALTYGPTYISGGQAVGDGHAWVVDGARTTNTVSADVYQCLYNGNIYENTLQNYSISSKIVKYNWGGWNANHNTWFNDNAFVWDATGGNYNINVKIIGSIQ